ncbi:MAG TPA: hypothetical protein VKE25_14485, partial [Actinomycetes bacterium]|nr:hypothetical protein [Actinomycetes bacterium]
MLRPLAAGGAFTPTVQRIAEAPVSVVRGVPGSYLAERLAGVIDNWQRLNDCVWLRTDGFRPTGLAQSLEVACQHRWSPDEPAPQFGLLSDPGPRLGEQIRQAPEGAVIVLELGGRVTAGVARLIRAIRPALTDRGVRLVVVAESRFQPPVGHRPDWVVPASELLDRSALVGYSSARNRARLVRYTGQRAAVLGDVLAAARQWSQDAVDEAVEASSGLPSLLDQLTRVLLSQLTPDQRSALEVAATLGYWHPQMSTHPIAVEQLRPWVVPLEQQWGWVRPIWMPTLRRELARPVGSGQSSSGHQPAAGLVAVPSGREATRT